MIFKIFTQWRIVLNSTEHSHTHLQICKNLTKVKRKKIAVFFELKCHSHRPRLLHDVTRRLFAAWAARISAESAPISVVGRVRAIPLSTQAHIHVSTSHGSAPPRESLNDASERLFILSRARVSSHSRRVLNWPFQEASPQENSRVNEPQTWCVCACVYYTLDLSLVLWMA